MLCDGNDGVTLAIRHTIYMLINDLGITISDAIFSAIFFLALFFLCVSGTTKTQCIATIVKVYTLLPDAHLLPEKFHYVQVTISKYRIFEKK